MKKGQQCEHKPSKPDKLVPDISCIIAFTLPKLVLVVVIKFLLEAVKGLTSDTVSQIWQQFCARPGLNWWNDVEQNRCTYTRHGQSRGKKERKQQRQRENRAHQLSAHDMKWEAQPGALNPLSASSFIQSQPPPYLPRHQQGRDLWSLFYYSVFVSGPEHQLIQQLMCHLKLDTI